MQIAQKRIFLTILLFLNYLHFASAQYAAIPAQEGLALYKECYPSDIRSIEYDKKVDDWFMEVQSKRGIIKIYWATGKLLPYELLKESDKYQRLLYGYPDQIPTPKSYTPSEKKAIANFSAPANRKNRKIQCSAFYDALYNSYSQESTFNETKKIAFLGFTIRTHKKIVPKLQRIQTKIYWLARRDKRINQFVKSLGSASSYAWREIRDSSNRSMHSYAIAVDILPKAYEKKVIYWLWEKDKNPENWMEIPLEERWLVPSEIIRIFEEEGFLYGGKWAIWDNMHFEYRPEVIKAKKFLGKEFSQDRSKKAPKESIKINEIKRQ